MKKVKIKCLPFWFGFFSFDIMFDVIVIGAGPQD